MGAVGGVSGAGLGTLTPGAEFCTGGTDCAWLDEVMIDAVAMTRLATNADSFIDFSKVTSTWVAADARVRNRLR
jgi:hypothetical protein